MRTRSKLQEGWYCDPKNQLKSDQITRSWLPPIQSAYEATMLGARVSPQLSSRLGDRWMPAKNTRSTDDAQKRKSAIRIFTEIDHEEGSRGLVGAVCRVAWQTGAPLHRDRAARRGTGDASGAPAHPFGCSGQKMRGSGFGSPRHLSGIVLARTTRRSPGEISGVAQHLARGLPAR